MRTSIIVAGYIIATSINPDVVTFNYPLASSIFIAFTVLFAVVADGTDLLSKIAR